MSIYAIKSVAVFQGTADAVQMGSYNIYSTEQGMQASTNLQLGCITETGFVPAAETRSFASVMTPEQYAKWGTDDQYAVDVFLTNAGLVRV